MSYISSRRVTFMQNKEKIRELIRAAKFTLISISAAIIDAGSFAILNKLLHIDIIFAQPISLILSVIWNFTINRKITFKSAANIKIAMLKVLGFYAVFTPLTTWFSTWAVSLGVEELIVKAITMVLNLVLEYLFCRYIVFGSSCDTADNSEKKGENSKEANNEKLEETKK